MRPLLYPLLFLSGILAAAPAAARDPLGVFEGWGAYRDQRPLRCFAIAEPAVRLRGGPWRPFAAITSWPGIGVRGQLHVRLRSAKKAGTPTYLVIGDHRFLLASGRAEAWAPDAAVDAAIVAAMRGGSSMSVEAIGLNGRPFADAYRLHGAASAIDAAALGCAKRG